MGLLNLARLLSLAIVGGSAAVDRPVALIAKGVAAWPEPRPMVNGPGHWWYKVGEVEDTGRLNQPPPNQMRTLSVAQLNPANGSVGSVLEPIPAGLGAGLTGVCNAAYSPGAFMKTTSDGKLLTVSAVTGAVTKTTVLTGAVPAQLGAETFMAGPVSAGLLYTAAPLSYTSYTIFSYNPVGGEVTAVATVPKNNLDGIGVCVGFVYEGGLFYVVTDRLVRFDLGTHKVSNATNFFPAPMAFDPAHPGSLIAVTEASPGHADGGSGGAGYQSSALVRFDLGTGVKTELYVWNSTIYKRKCYCDLPIRPQDPADMAVSDDGATVWVVLSYNDTPNAKHESLITRGMFVLKIAGDTATLESATEAWSGNDVVKRPWIGSMAVVPGGALVH